MSELEELLERYKGRPARVSSKIADNRRTGYLQGLACSKIEGFEPNQHQLDAIELLSTKRVSEQEYKDLCMKIAIAKKPTTTPT